MELVLNVNVEKHSSLMISPALNNLQVLSRDLGRICWPPDSVNLVELHSRTTHWYAHRAESIMPEGAK
jgi:hypothetical protein